MKGILATDNEFWSTSHIPEKTTKKDLGEQVQDIAAAPRTTPKFIRPDPKTKGKPRCCLQVPMERRGATKRHQ